MDAIESPEIPAGLALLWPVNAAGQAPPASSADQLEKQIIQERLSSNVQSEVAWGAYLAANYKQKSFIPAITQLLKSDNRAIVAVALDALIRLEADVPEDALAPLSAGPLPDVLIL